MVFVHKEKRFCTDDPTSNISRQLRVCIKCVTAFCGPHSLASTYTDPSAAKAEYFRGSYHCDRAEYTTEPVGDSDASCVPLGYCVAQEPLNSCCKIHHMYLRQWEHDDQRWFQNRPKHYRNNPSQGMPAPRALQCRCIYQAVPQAG